MKKGLNIFVGSVFAFSIILLGVQACGPKSRNAESADVSATPVVPVASTPTLAERRARLAQERAARLSKRETTYAEWSKHHVTYFDADGNKVYSRAETPPSYVGGEEAMNKFLRDNVQYPQDAKDNGDEGTVFVDFIVGADGVVRYATATDEVGQNMDQELRDEAVRLVNSMPNWNPGRQHGTPVPVKFSVPVTFELE